MELILIILLSIYSIVITFKFFVVKNFMKKWIRILKNTDVQNLIPNNDEIKEIITTVYSNDDK